MCNSRSANHQLAERNILIEALIESSTRLNPIGVHPVVWTNANTFVFLLQMIDSL